MPEPRHCGSCGTAPCRFAHPPAEIRVATDCGAGIPHPPHDYVPYAGEPPVPCPGMLAKEWAVEPNPCGDEHLLTLSGTCDRCGAMP